VVIGWIATLRFFTNHIIGVIDQVLKEPNRDAKIARANEQGWSYFRSPVESLLSKRLPAQRPGAVKVQQTPELLALYELVAATLLDADMTAAEVRMLVVDLPKYTKSPADLREAIRICRARSARSIHYLIGILRRGEQKRQTKVIELKEMRSERGPWVPPVGPTLADTTVDRLQDRWRNLFAQPEPENERWI
jgi:hypothetical protein